MDANFVTLADMPEVINALQISEYLHISYVKALHTIKYGGIPYKRLGNTYRVSKRQFEIWLNSSQQ